MPRVRYSMYLEEETCNNLMDMYRACYDEGYRDMILTAAFISYDVASLEDKGVIPAGNYCKSAKK